MLKAKYERPFRHLGAYNVSWPTCCDQLAYISRFPIVDTFRGQAPDDVVPLLSYFPRNTKGPGADARTRLVGLDAYQDTHSPLVGTTFSPHPVALENTTTEPDATRQWP